MGSNQALTRHISGVSSIFKRGVIGTYHHMREARLRRYWREFDLRYNTGKMTDGERANVILKGMEGTRLPTTDLRPLQSFSGFWLAPGSVHSFTRRVSSFDPKQTFRDRSPDRYPPA